MVRLEDEGRPQSNGGLAAASDMNSEPPQFRDDLVPSGSGVTIYGAECSATPGIPQVLRIPGLTSRLTIISSVFTGPGDRGVLRGACPRTSWCSPASCQSRLCPRQLSEEQAGVVTFNLLMILI